MFFGALMVLFGLLMLLDRMGYLPGDLWEYFWPLALIALGISIVLKHRSRDKNVH